MVEKSDNCEIVWREISNYVDGEVDAPLRATMDEHFRTCVRCAAVLAGTRNVVQLYGDDRMLLDVPSGFSRRLEKSLAQNARGSRTPWSSWSAWLVPVAAMALILGAVMVANSVPFKNYVQSLHAQPGNNVPPEMVVVVSAGSKLFHVAGCPFIHDKASERTITAKEATQEGFTPCPRCLRQYLKTGMIQHSDTGTAREEVEEEQEETLGSISH
jgi:hypothetical protein